MWRYHRAFSRLKPSWVYLLAYCQLFQTGVVSLGGTNLGSSAREQCHVHIHDQPLAEAEPTLLTPPQKMN